MANLVYDKGREGFLDGDIDWSADNIKAMLIRSAGGGTGPYYTINAATHQFLDDIPNNTDCRVATSANLTTKTSTDGVADAADVTYSSVAAGDATELIIIFQDTAVEGTSRLIAAIDTAINLPVTPNGGDIAIQWAATADRIFRL